MNKFEEVFSSGIQEEELNLPPPYESVEVDETLDEEGNSVLGEEILETETFVWKKKV